MTVFDSPLLDLPFSRLEIVCFDIEATGLRKSTARIVELAAVKLRGVEISKDVFQSLCRPDYPIPPRTIRIHGITDEDVSEAPDPTEVIGNFFRWAGSDCLFAAHNAHYDVAVLARNALRAGCEIPSNLAALDTLGWSRRWLEAPDYKLETLAKVLKIEPEGEFHRALSDARILAGMTSEMIKGLGMENTPRDLLNLISPEALVTPPPIPRMRVRLPDHLRLLESALSDRRSLVIGVRDRRKGNYLAEVRPLFFLMEGDRLLMEAWSEKLGEVRTYPVDAIIEVKLVN